MIRQPIIAVLGHVDHGKTLLLDSIRGTAIAAKEAGGITQAIGASIIPAETLKKICGKLSIKITVPGLLFVDTPGHAAFASMRKRGGNIADLAILVVDINEGFMPQTIESIEILKNSKTPFTIAANKIDKLSGWRSAKTSLLENINSQLPQTHNILENKLYELVAKLSEQGLQSERFDRVSDFTKQIPIVPVSAKTSEGIPELLMMLCGIAQKFIDLNTDVSGPGKGTILEIRERKGIGKAIDIIIYDGCINVGDSITSAGLNGPLTGKIKALMLPAPLSEMRAGKSFKSVKEVCAATGVRITSPGLEESVAGMPIITGMETKKAEEEISKQIASVIFESQEQGIIAKADSLGSLEALIILCKENNIPVRTALIGEITKKDITDAESAENPFHQAILAFNIKIPENYNGTARIITGEIIYRIIEDYQEWTVSKKKEIEQAELNELVMPCKIKILKGYVFRQSNPAVFGVEVLNGTLKPNTPLLTKQGKQLGAVKGVQKDQENIKSACKGAQVAVELPGATIGRQIKEEDELYSAVPEEHFRKFKDLKQHLSNEEKETLKEIAKIMRENNPVWGV